MVVTWWRDRRHGGWRLRKGSERAHRKEGALLTRSLGLGLYIGSASSHQQGVPHSMSVLGRVERAKASKMCRPPPWQCHALHRRRNDAARAVPGWAHRSRHSSQPAKGDAGGGCLRAGGEPPERSWAVAPRAPGDAEGRTHTTLAPKSSPRRCVRRTPAARLAHARGCVFCIGEGLAPPLPPRTALRVTLRG